MKKLWAAVAGAALVCAGCPVTDMAGTPEWTPYGMIKASVSLDTNGSTNPGSGDYVTSVANADTDGRTSMTARDSRVGGTLDMGAIKGKIEIDFHGETAAPNTGDVLFRHAYLTLDLGKNMTLLAGQTDDVFSPLCPNTLNYTVGWNVGNVGHRSPQIRWTWAPETGLIEGVAVALSDPNSALIVMPDLQARVGFRLSQRLLLGGSILIGKTDIGAAGEEDIFGLGVDVNAKLSEKLKIVGEWHTGKNLINYMGNVGVQYTNAQDIGDDSLWVAVDIKLKDNLAVNAGWMFDSNDEDDLPGIAGNNPEDNSCIFGNIIWSLNENTDVGIEVSKWETEYELGQVQDNLRIQGSLIVRF